jgi:hypothetical protein
MTSAATATLSIQYTPPNAATNSGSVLYPVVANYNAQNVGQFDLLSTETAPIVNPVPFGSVSQCLMLIIKNGQATDIGIQINNGVQLSGVAASISFLGGVNTITGLSGMTQAIVGKSITLQGSTTPANNGAFLIASVLSATSVTVTNASGATDSSAHVVWVLNMTIDNFKIPSGGVLMFAAPQASGVPANTPPESFISSVTVTSYAVPAVGNVETISYFVFGN